MQVLRVLLHNRMRALDFYGKIVSVFLLCCCITLYQGVKNAVMLYKLNQLISLDLFTYALPFVCFILDGAIKRCYSISASYFFIIIKVLLVVYYLGMYVFSLQRNPPIVISYTVCVNQIVFPFVMIGYWRLLVAQKLSG